MAGGADLHEGASPTGGAAFRIGDGTEWIVAAGDQEAWKTQ